MRPLRRVAFEEYSASCDGLLEALVRLLTVAETCHDLL